MKKPRVKDFDPVAAHKLGSPLINMPVIEKPRQGKTPKPPSFQRGKDKEKPKQNERSNERTNVPTLERKNERVILRHTFDIFKDQLRDLQLLQLNAVKSDKKKPKLGEMVRQAIDNFLVRKEEKKETE